MSLQPPTSRCVLRDYHLPGRDPRFPPIKITNEHPLVQANNFNRIFVLLLDTTDEGILANKEFEDGLTLPKGTPDYWEKEYGLLRLQPGDFVLLRSKGCEDPEKDVVTVVTTDESHQSDADTQLFTKAAEEVLGTPDQLANGTTELEDTGSTIPAKDGVRAFALGTTVERVTFISAPAAAGKGVASGPNEYHRLVKNLVSASGRLVVNIFRRLPKQYCKAIEGNSSIVNLPAIGADGNVLASNVQLNIASVAGGGGVEEGLVGDLGARYGGAHADHRDHPGYFSVMLCYPKYPPSYDPGHFHILHLGIFAPTNRHSAILFSGQRRHACTPAIVPAGAMPDPAATRLHVIYYPRESAVTGSVRHTIGSLPQPADTLSVTSEMINASNLGHVPQGTNRSTFINDGSVLMSRTSHVNFVGRSLLQLLCYGLRQMDPTYKVNMDTNSMLKHITFEDEDGKRISLQPWDEAPEVMGVPSARLKAEKAFQDHCDHVSKFIPQVAAKVLHSSNDRSTPCVNPNASKPLTSRKRKNCERPPPEKRGDNVEESQPENECGWKGEHIDENGTSWYGFVAISDCSERYKVGKRRRVEEDVEEESFQDGVEQQSISSEKASLESDYAAWTVATSMDKRKGILSLAKTSAILESAPLSQSAPAQAQTLSIKAKELERSVGANDFIKRFEQRDVMLLSTLVWRWSDIMVANEVERRVGEKKGWVGTSVERMDWIDELAAQVVEMLVQKKRDWLFDPTARPLLRALGSSSYRHVNPLSRRTFIRSDPSFPRTVSNVAREILPRWLGMTNSTGHDHRIRAWFVEAVMNKLGRQVLTTHLMWNAFTTFKSRHYVEGFSIYHTSTPDTSLFVPFLDELAAHPILDRNSTIGRVYWNYVPYTPNPQYKAMPGGDLGCAQDVIEYIIQQIAKETRADSTMGPSCMQITSNPIREMDPDRQHYAGVDGPYILPFLQTESGLFSAAILVGVLHRTEYSRTERLRFDDDKDFFCALTEYRLLLGRPDDIDLIEVLGMAESELAAKPSVDGVREGWERCRLSGWVELSRRNPTFVECLGFLLRFSNGQMRHPILTLYGVYYLACDMAYAGLCQAPNIQDVALMMNVTMTASFEALARLGLVDHSAGSNSSQIKDVLEYLLGQLNRNHQVRERYKEGVDVIMLEYALGTFIRYAEAKAVEQCR
ncbi:hypothetical protein MD484_g7901, partial [Candolleomyces efflorescens]